jgi:hypothetical protein
MQVLLSVLQKQLPRKTAPVLKESRSGREQLTVFLIQVPFTTLKPDKFTGYEQVNAFTPLEGVTPSFVVSFLNKHSEGICTPLF